MEALGSNAMCRHEKVVGDSNECQVRLHKCYLFHGTGVSEYCAHPNINTPSIFNQYEYEYL